MGTKSHFCVAAALWSVGCGTTASNAAPAEDTATDAASTAEDAVSGNDAAVATDVAPSVLGSCGYKNLFSKGDECKSYTGSTWTAASAQEDCQNAMGGPGTFAPGQDCAFAALLGTCTVAKEGEPGYLLLSGGSDASKCASAKLGCETFAGGAFVPGNTCADSTTGTDPGTTPGEGYGSTPFVQPYQVCKDPLPGEPAGQGPGGKVCTNVLVSGCTEAGRHFEDYGKCADVLTQRPYWPAKPAKATDPADPRLKDPEFIKELAWSREQVAASACVCCHTTKLAPNGPSNWRIDDEGIWLDGVKDSGMAMFLGVADSTQLGAYPAKDNNGFDRTTLGLPTTDIPRMKKFLLAEWTRRGKTIEDAKTYAPFGGPLVAQSTYEPAACEAGEGVAADGKVTWLGGDARYVYVMAKGSKNPGVPPNLDLPEGTVWHVAVPNTKPAVKSGLAYGQVSGDLVQRVPATGAAPTLVKGQTYYLYVLQDIGFPASRCLFTAP